MVKYIALPWEVPSALLCWIRSTHPKIPELETMIKRKVLARASILNMCQQYFLEKTWIIRDCFVMEVVKIIFHFGLIVFLSFFHCIFHCKKKHFFIQVSSKSYCWHIYQIEARDKTFLSNIVSHSGIFGWVLDFSRAMSDKWLFLTICHYKRWNTEIKPFWYYLQASGIFHRKLPREYTN